MPDYPTSEETDLETEENEETKEEEEGAGGNLLSPEGFIMMFMAVFFDVSQLMVQGMSALISPVPVIGQILFFGGEIFSKIISFAALIFFGIWMLIRSGMARGAKKRTVNVEKMAKWAKKLRIFAPIAEFIPIIGALPCWTIAVYLELKYGGK